MPLNPCGRLVDFARRPYTTACRFFRDSELQANIVWYPCLPDAPDLGIASPFLSRDWEVTEDAWGIPDDPGPGEVGGAPRVFNRKQPIPAATGAHRCGTDEEWRKGALYNPDRPPVLYRPDGLPTCCAPGRGLLWFGARPAPRGGVLWFGPQINSVVGTVDCTAAPVLAPGVVYTQEEFPLPAPGTGLWYSLGAGEAGPHSCELVELPGPNSLDVVQLRFGPTCLDSSAWTTASSPPWLFDTSDFDGFNLWIVFQPTTLGTGEPCPRFTITHT